METKKYLAVLVVVMLGIIAIGYGYNKYQHEETRVGVVVGLAKGSIAKCYSEKRNGEKVDVSCESIGMKVS
jgi:hypothetical protein